MTNPKDDLMLVPIEILRVIPLFNGDKSQLNLFIRKCEYVIDMYEGDYRQNLYLLHTITSRLVDKAASLISEREGVDSWGKLKELLIENYSDTRSEESIEIDFQSLRINTSENFLSFYNRLQALHKVLVSKIDSNIDEAAKCKKITQYNKMAITVLLYNVPEYLAKMVRLRQPNTLEEAYNIVTDEITFFQKYSKNQAKCLNTVPEFRCFYGNFYQPFFNAQPNFNKPCFGAASAGLSSTAGQGMTFGSTSAQVPKQNQNNQSLFGSQSNPKPAGFGISYGGFGQINNPVIVKTNDQFKSLVPASNALHPNEEE